MRTFIFCLLPLFFVQGVRAQITYSSNEYASIGDTFLLSRAQLNLNQFDYANAGANISWDFSTLTAATQRTERFVDPSTAGYELAFISNCILNGGGIFNCPQEWNALTDIAQLDMQGGALFSLLPVSISNVVRHFAIDNQSLSETILGVSIGTGPLSAPIPIVYDNIDTLYRFPLAIGNMDSSIREFSIDLNNVGTDFLYQSYQKRINHVEGWGSLTTPYANYPSVLKLKTIIQNQDSIVTNGQTLPGDITTEVRYSWFAPNIGWPVFVASGQVVAGIEVITQVEYLDTLQCIQPNPLFIATPIPAFIDPTSGSVDINFTNLSQNADQYTWDFGDGGSANTQSPSHTYTDGGIFQVQLIACNQLCQPLLCDTATIPLIILDTAGVTATFFVQPENACVDDSVQFTSIAFNSDQYLWDFGDGNTSTEENPQHAYISPGSYDISLIIMNANDQDTIVQTLVVSDIPTVSVSPDTSVSLGNSVQLLASASDPDATYAWNLSADLSCFTCSDPIATPSETSVYTVIVSNACGSASDTVRVEIDSVSTGISSLDLNELGIKMYPNPVEDHVIIQFPEQLIEPIELELISSFGQLVFAKRITDQQQKINLPSLSTGIYFLRFSYENHLLTIPVIKH